VQRTINIKPRNEEEHAKKTQNTDIEIAIAEEAVLWLEKE
jgi:hypothetical protein